MKIPKISVTGLLAAAITVMMSALGHQSALAQTSAYDWKGTDPATAASATAGSDENTVFLYNVSTGKFLNCGGFWGVAAITSEVGMEFTVTQSGNSYIFKTKMVGQNSSQTGAFVEQETCLTYDSNEKQYVLDRTVSQATDGSSTQYYGKYTVTATTGGYTLVTNSRYMAAGQSDDATSVEDKTNAITGFSSQPSTGAVWKLVTLKERKQAFMKASNDTKNYVPGTFLVLDNDFARRNAYITSWNGGTTALDYSTNTYSEQAATPANQTLAYYVGNGVEDTQGNSYKWTGNAKGADVDLNQKIEPFRHGWYEIRCRAFCTTTTGKSVLYAKVGDATSKTDAKTNYAEAVITKISAPSTYILAHDEVNKSATADGTTYYPYEVVVRVYVPKTSTEGGELGSDGTYSYETCSSLTFGVKTTGGASTDWICVDNFELEYLGEGNGAVILDETQPDITYLNEQITGKNSTVYLNRSFTANAWNSIVLPFDMSKSDIIDIFGSGSIVSKYKGAKDDDRTTIYFEQTTSIEKGKLYLIKPTVGEPDANGVSVSSEKELTLATMDNSGNVTKSGSKSTLTLSKAYYTIPNIVFGELDSEGNAKEFGDEVTDTTAPVVTGGNYYTFAGTYVKKMNVIPLHSYRLNALNDDDHTGSKNEWVVNHKSLAHSLGFRGWLRLAKEGEYSAPLSFVINGVADGTTAIDGITAGETTEAHATGIYNLNGQRVAASASQLNILPSGMYIVNGKKVVK